MQVRTVSSAQPVAWTPGRRLAGAALSEACPAGRRLAGAALLEACPAGRRLAGAAFREACPVGRATDFPEASAAKALVALSRAALVARAEGLTAAAMQEAPAWEIPARRTRNVGPD